MATTEAGGAADEAKWLRWRGVGRPLSRVFHRLDPHRLWRGAGPPMPRNSCSGFFAASSKSVSCPAWKNSASAICRRRWRRRNIIISRTGSAACRSRHVRDRPQGLDPLPTAALDLARHRDLRACPAKCRARCCEAGTPTTALRSAIPTSACLHQAERRRPGRVRGLLL